MMRVKADYVRPNGIKGTIITIVSNVELLEQEILEELAFGNPDTSHLFKVLGFEVIEHVGIGQRPWTFRNNV